ncbi:LPS export ABC transporter periplasmic protein LptC [Marinobacter subterrani]|uniref:Lipopolysaccharide export system protein LptC n=1 Tax=Marinobacter subterrani TaxID=1658765 RepID=A0A0J7JCZ7_9GAMM|nr:LPS export ABC transporter periplasmic protein LptC [Marinobacter subterrani]KMQ75661.1 Lipopolysaccharide export system protein LptC [Marinobacter subterrani]
MSWLPDRPWLRTLALAGTLAAVMFLMWQSDEPPVTNQKAAELRGDAEPDGFVVNGEYTSFDETGNLKISFTSPRIEQFEEGNLATMVSPKAKLFGNEGNANAEPWIIEAENGSLLQNENLLYLTGNVRILRSVGGRDTTLTTSTLTLDNDRSMAYTDAPVVIRDVTGITHAVGMKAWIDERVLELNSKVEGRYETGN